MRGQWVDYETFNLVDLIDEVKTRMVEPHSANDTVHGAFIVGKDYYGTCSELRKYLSENDKKGV